MRTILRVIKVIFFLIVLLISSCVYYFHQKSATYDPVAIPFIEEVMPKLSTWDLATHRLYSTHESNERINDEDLTRSLKWLSKLGSLVSIEKPKLTGVMNDNFITYDFVAHYKNGDAGISMQIEDDNGKFLINEFHVESWH